MNEAEFKKIASLEEAYSRWQNGTLEPKYLKRAALLQCECGGLSPCMQSEHDRLAAEMFSAGEQWEGKRRV